MTAFDSINKLLLATPCNGIPENIKFIKKFAFAKDNTAGRNIFRPAVINK